MGTAPPGLWLQMEKQFLAHPQQGPSAMADQRQAMDRGAARQATRQYGRSCARCGVVERQVGRVKASVGLPGGLVASLAGSRLAASVSAV